MSNLLNAGVMQGLIGAYTSVQQANVSMSVYHQAKTANDTETAERALGYATDSMTDAQDSNDAAQEALEKAQEKAAEEEKEAQKAELEKPKKGETKPASAKPNSQNSEIHLKHPTDRIEISKEGKEYTNTSEAPENTSGAESIPVSQPDTVENPLPEILANAQKAKTAPKTS